jgi:hypothetical protein
VLTRPLPPASAQELPTFLEYERHYDNIRHIRQDFEVTNEFARTESEMAARHVLIVVVITIFLTQPLLREVGWLYAALSLAVFVIAIAWILTSAHAAMQRLMSDASAAYQEAVRGESDRHTDALRGL